MPDTDRTLALPAPAPLFPRLRNTHMTNDGLIASCEDGSIWRAEFSFTGGMMGWQRLTPVPGTAAAGEG